MKKYFNICSFMLLGSLFSNAQTTNFQSVAVKSVNGPTLSTKNSPGLQFSSVNFVSGVDIPSGHTVVEVIVEIVWSKTDDGSCGPTSGLPVNLQEVGFGIQGPSGPMRYLAASNSTGPFASPTTSSSFTGSANINSDIIVFRDGYPNMLPATLPVMGRDTVAPNNAALTYYRGSSPYGNWSVFLIDDLPSTGPALCIHSYNIKLITCDAATLNAVCKTNISKSVNALGNYIPTFVDFDNGSDVSCYMDNVTFSPSSLNCSNVGTAVPVTMTIKDKLNNLSSCITNVNIIDNVKPVISNCFPSIFTTGYLNQNGDYTFYASNANITDNCGSVTKKVRKLSSSIFADSTVFSCVTGNQLCWVKGTDNSGNVDSCRYVITIIDTVKPIAVCQNYDVYITSNGTTGPVNAINIDGGSTDVCNNISNRWINAQFAPPPSYGCDDIGPHNVTLIVSDPSNNLSSCSAVINVIKANPGVANQSVTKCNGGSLTVNGHTYTVTGQYTDTLVELSSIGCDSILVTDLTILDPIAWNLNTSLCSGDDITVNGTIYNSSNPTGTEVFLNTGLYGCDSTVTINLNIIQPTAGDTTATACSQFIWYGNTYNSSNDYTHALLNSVGCDSVITLHLTITQPTTGDTTATACSHFTWYGNTYNVSNNYMHDLTNVAGCDSTIILHLTINDLPDNSTTISGETITASVSGATYKWIDCDNNSVISGETSQVFTATENGNYAVIVDNGICSDTSSCITIASAGVTESSVLEGLTIYPNPTSGIITISSVLGVSKIEIFDIQGKLMLQKITDLDEIDLTYFESGVYLMHITDSNEKVIVKRIYRN